MKKEKIAFFIILIIGAILRFYNFAEWSLSNDELSALMRLKFDTMSSLIEQGIKVDGHPAATQIFEYFWVKIFGDSPAALRFPFVIFGILSIYYAYKTACFFIGNFAALFVAAFIAVSELFILYSQIARPYSMGCFLLLFFSYYWVLHLKGNKKLKVSIAFILSGSLAIMTHYFASLALLLFLIAGTFIVKKVHLKFYLIHIAFIVLLCLPHTFITVNHFAIGGVGAWLPLPDAGFLWRFLNFTSNDFIIFQLLLILTPILSVFSGFGGFSFKWGIFSFFIFFLCFIIGYEYSLHVSAVLQFSVLIFSTPFLIICFFAPATFKSKKNLGYALLTLLMISGIYALIVRNDFYEQKKFADFKSVSQSLEFYQDSLQPENTYVLMNSSSSEYFDYYFESQNFETEIAIEQFKGPKDLSYLQDLLINSKKEYIIIAWANVAMPYEVHELVKQYYPKRIIHHHFFNSEFSIYSKQDKKRRKIFQLKHDLEAEVDSWDIGTSSRDTNEFYSAKHSLKIDSNTEYALTYRNKIQSIFKENSRFLTASVFVKMPEKTDCKIVITIERKEELLEWRSYQLQDYYKEDKWFQALFVFELKETYLEDDRISIYLWNPNKSKLFIDDFTLSVFEDSDYDYYDLH